MKVSGSILLPALCGLAGFGVVYSLVEAPPSPSRLSLVAADAAQGMGSANRPNPDDKTGAAAGERSAASGIQLAARIRVMLEQLGIDSSWAEGLAAAEVSGFPELLEKMRTLPDAHQERLKELLFARWAALDPLGGAEFFKSKKDEDSLTELFRQWQRLDFKAAADKAGEYGDKILRRTLRDKALLDPAGLLVWLKDRPDLNPLTLFSSGADENVEALKQLADTDPDKMLAWLRQAPEDKWDQGFVNSFAERLARRSPEEAIAWVKSLKDPRRSAFAMTGVAKALAASDPARAAGLLAALPLAEDYEASWALFDAIGKFEFKDADKVLALIGTLPQGELKTQMIKKTLIGLLETDPAKAFSTAEAAGLDAGSTMWWVVPDAAKTPDGARRLLEAAGRAGDSSFRDAIVKETLLAWMDSDPGSLNGYLKDKMDTPLLSSMKKNLQEGLAVQMVRDGKMNPDLFETLGLSAATLTRIQAESDPARAARTLEEVEDPEARRRAAEEVAGNYTVLDRGAAVTWAETLKDPEAQASAWKAIAADWVKEDSWQASEWIARLPAGQGRDSAVLAMTGEIGKSDPDLAWKWALSMNDSALRNEALTAAAMAWRQKDPSGLREALNDSSLSAAGRQAVLDKLNPSPEPAK